MVLDEMGKSLDSMSLLTTRRNNWLASKKYGFSLRSWIFFKSLYPISRKDFFIPHDIFPSDDPSLRPRTIIPSLYHTQYRTLSTPVMLPTYYLLRTTPIKLRKSKKSFQKSSKLACQTSIGLHPLRKQDIL